MEEEIVNPISTDQPVALKDLAGETQATGEARKIKEKKKNSYIYYLGLGSLMVVLVFFGLFFGLYLRGRNSEPLPVTPSPSPAAITTQPPASPASTMEVIQKKMGTLDSKLKTTDLAEDKLLPPQLDYDLKAKLEDLDQ
jgi:hypothetical protein